MELWFVRFGLRGYKYWVGKELHRLWSKSVLRSGLLDMSIGIKHLSPQPVFISVSPPLPFYPDVYF